MKITGVQKTSLIDYPEKIASVIFTQGCNFKCPYCHNAELIPLEQENGYFSINDVLSFLKTRKGLIDGITITGGEPTLQPGLTEFISRVKELGLLVKLDTNGSRPVLLQQLITAKLVDYLAMDVKAPLNRYSSIIGVQLPPERIHQSIRLIEQAGRESGLAYEFRTTVVPGLHTEEDIKSIGELIESATSYYLQNFKPASPYDPELSEKNGFTPTQLARFQDIVRPFVQNVQIRD